MMISIPYESTVAVKPAVVGWCPHCKIVYPDHASGFCDGGHEWALWAFKKYGNGDWRRLRKRRMWGCPHCDMWFLTRVALLDHHHEWA